MTERTAVPERVSQRAKTVRRSGGAGSQGVGNYVGQPAGDAAQAVRRAGLRPGLDRSFGCPEELIGLVVAQDPAAGSDLARKGMVTLYVAAPGGESLDDGADTQAASDVSDGEPATPEPIKDAPSPPTVPARARRRKRGLAQRPPAATEPPPPPSVPGEATSEHAPAQTAAQPPGEWTPEIDAPAAALEDDLADDPGEHEPPHEDFVVHVEDVLAGRSGPPGWRGSYPRRRHEMRGVSGRGRMRAWVGEHRMLTGTISAALALWVVVGAASAVDGHHAHPPSASAVAPSREPAARHLAPAPKPSAVQKSTTSRTAARSSHPYTLQHPVARDARPRPVQRHAPRPVRPAAPAVKETVTATATPAPTPAPAPRRSEATAPPASTASASAPEQSGGGLFSP
jgi:hypothetical protein